MAYGTLVSVGGWLGGKKEKYIVESDGNPYTAVGREFVGVRGFLHGKVDKKEDIVRFGTYIIQNFRNGGLESALHGMSHANVGLGILQDTKITYGVYARESAGFLVVVLGALSLHHGGVALIYKELLRFALKSYIASVLPAYRAPPQLMAPEAMHHPFNLNH